MLPGGVDRQGRWRIDERWLEEQREQAHGAATSAFHVRRDCRSGYQRAGWRDYRSRDCPGNHRRSRNPRRQPGSLPRRNRERRGRADRERARDRGRSGGRRKRRRGGFNRRDGRSDPAPTLTEGMLSAAGKLQMLSLTHCTVGKAGVLDATRHPAWLTTHPPGSRRRPDTLLFLNNLPRLTTLVLEDATATDLLPIGALTELSTLSLYGCAAADYASLADLPSLEKLYCSENAALPELACRVTRRRLIGVR